MKLLALTLGCIGAFMISGRAADTPPKVDNTAINKRDQKSDAKTPGDQSNSKEDIRITADIRKAIVGDKSLTMTAKNVKIITAGGLVTLRGPVTTADEKTKISNAARSVAGADKVTDNLEIKK